MWRFFDIIRSAFGGEATGGASEVVTVDLRAAGEDDGNDETDAEVWGPACIAYRPPDPDGETKCQALTITLAGKRAVVATRDPRAADCAGELAPGDVALWSIGKNAVRLNADGGMALHKQGESVDSLVTIDTTGAIFLSNEWGQIELGPDGFKVITKTGESLLLGGGQFQVTAPQGKIACGTVGLGPAPARPLTFAPPSGVAGPAPNILV